MRIGELAVRSGVPPKTIRYYEQIDLIPAPPRTAGGYREFGEDAAGRLAFIRAAQSIGLSLGEIREILAFRDRGQAPCSHVATLIGRHAAHLSERIAALERMRRDLEQLIETWPSPSSTETRSSTYCHIIEARASGIGGRDHAS